VGDVQRRQSQVQSQGCRRGD